MPWKPAEPGDYPTLGWQVLDWITDMLAAPDRADYEPFVPYREQAAFVLRFYELDRKTGKRKIRRGVLSRPRGWGKSPFLGALACVEALGPVVFDGWDAEGQPVGKPWATVRTPLVQIAAVSETQTKNTWGPLLEMLSAGPVTDAYPGLEPLDTFVNLPRGRIEPITSSARTTKGNRAVFAVLDQTEEWVTSNGGVRLAETMRINAGKIGGTTVETPNAFVPGEGSVAEQSAAYRSAIIEGKTRDSGLLYDHREAPGDTDLTDRKSLLAGLEHAYGDSAAQRGGHVDLDRIVAEVWDPSNDVQRVRADFLNQITHASDSWISQPEWASRYVDDVVSDRTRITLGFDGSKHRNRGVTDASALIGCRVSDGHVFEIGVWEQPTGPAGDGWWAPVEQINAAVRTAFSRYKVVGFFADPAADWSGHVSAWEAAYGPSLAVKSRRDEPIKWWMNQQTAVARAVEQFEAAVVHGELTHDGSSALTRHVLNARRRPSRGGMSIAKEHPDSARKVDAAVAAVLAWQARLAAVSAGVNDSQEFVPRRIR